MLTAISALNESSNSETSSEESNYEQDFQEEDYVAAYNAALGMYGNGNLTSAEKSFRKLLNSEYFKQCGFDSKRPQPVAKKLQFNTLRYLGIILGNNGSREEALDYLQRAIKIDQNDVTLYFKLAYFAALSKKFHMARSALEESLYNQQHNGEQSLMPTNSEDESDEEYTPPAPIRHWPSLDLLITMTYKLGDFISCLKYIAVALHENPDYEKGHKLRKKIYAECPYIDPDPSNWNNEPDLSRIKFDQVPKPIPAEKILYTINISDWNMHTLASALFNRYAECGETELLLEPCKIEFKEKIHKENPDMNKEHESIKNSVNKLSMQSSTPEEDEVVVLGSDDDIVILDDDSEESDITLQSEEGSAGKMKTILDLLIDKVIFSVHQRENQHSSEIVSPIVIGVVDSVIQVSTKAFIQSVLYNVVDQSVTENYSFISNLQSASKRKAGVSQFLSGVPSDLIEKRRSTRAKGPTGIGIVDKYLGTSGENTLSSPKCEEITAKQLLQGYFPKSLLNTCRNGNKIEFITSPDKKSREVPKINCQLTPVANSIANHNSIWLSPIEEKEFVESYVSKVCSTPSRSLIRQMEEFLLSVASKHETLNWPRALCNAYLKCYVIWRGHTEFPDEFEPQTPHRFIPVVIIANEIVLQMKITEDRKAEEIIDDDCTEENEDQQELDTHFEEDLQHLIFNLFRVEPSQGARILSLQLNDFRRRNKKPQAIVIGERLKDYLEKNSLKNASVIHSPVPDYEVFTCCTIESFVEGLEQKRLFSQICELYDKREFKLVRQILASNLPRAVKTEQSTNNDNRLFHLKMMIETLWNLDEFEECLGWIEVALHETKVQMLNQSCSSTSPDLTAKQYIDLLKTLDCCLSILDEDCNFAGIDDSLRPRLASNLLDLCLEQVEGKEQILEGNQTTLPWVLLYKLISYAEKQQQEQQQQTTFESPPGSISFLCSAHDYLGQLSMCTKDDGRLLILQGDAIVSTLFKGVKERAIADQLRKNLDQAMYCLYAHPSKKSKLKHLVDHAVPNIALRWDRCMSPYQYLRPEKLPEYDDFKSNSILAETVLFFKRIVALIPDHFDLQGRNRAVKEFLTSGSDKDFPKFTKIAQKDRSLLDVLYLLADYYFKNNEFITALEYYRYDLCFNQDRVDSWFPLALSLVNVLEQKINETYKEPCGGKVMELTSDIINRIIVDSDVIMKCYERCHILSPKNSMICIESANFAYTMHSFCTRQQNIYKDSEEQLFSKLKDKAPVYLKYASEYYDKALNLMEAQDEPDEMWLLHFMKGKILEKENLPIQSCLLEYEKALDKLLEQNATLPKKISYNSPAEFSLELLEVYYRIHATILKYEFEAQLPIPKEALSCITQLLHKIACSKIFVGGNTPAIESKSKDDKVLSESDFSEPPAKVSKIDNTAESLTWNEIATKCIEALESIIKRFPQHFKSVHLFSKYHLKTSTNLRDVNKAQKYLWGQITSGSKLSNYSTALFGERKSNNLFNGIWRLPISEIDRAGSFSTHINKCMMTLMDLALEMKDQSILLEVALQLRRPPDVNQKCLYERQRKHIALNSYSLVKKVLKSKVEDHIKYDSSQENRLCFLFELYQTYSKLRRLWQSKDESMVSLMVDLFKSIGGNGTSEEVLSFCMKVNSMSKKGMDNPQSLAALVKGDPIEFMRKEVQLTRQLDAPKTPPVSNANNTTSGSGSKVSQLAAESSLPSTSAAAAMEYLNAASSYYTNELQKMAAYIQSASGYASAAEAQALISAYASYGLLESVAQQNKSPVSSNKPKDSAKKNPSAVQKGVPTVDPLRSNTAMKKSTTISQKTTFSSGVTISKINQAQQQSTTSSNTGKNLQIFSHKPQNNVKCMQSKSDSNISKAASSYSASTLKQMPSKASSQNEVSRNMISSGIQAGSKQAKILQKSVPQTSMAKKTVKMGNISTLPASKITKDSLEKAKLIARQQKHPNTGISTIDQRLKKLTGSSNLATVSKQNLNIQGIIASGSKQKPKSKSSTTATSKLTKQKLSQLQTKPTPSQKNISQPTTSKSQSVDDDDVICID